MKRVILLLTCLAVVLTACHHEGPVNVIGQDDLSTVKYTVDKGATPIQLIYTLYLPDRWCEAPSQDSIRPFIIYFNGQKNFNFDVISRHQIYHDYYAQSFWAERDQVVSVVMTYGSYINGNDPANANFAKIDNRDNQFVLHYQPTDNRADDVDLLGFTMVGGSVTPLVDPNQLVPLRAEIFIGGDLRVGKEITFRVINLKFSPIIGLNQTKTQSLFDDGLIRNGLNFSRTFDYPGWHSVTLTVVDNLGKKITVCKDFTISN